ncbi:MAG: hypothetical protein HOP19_00825 [Acidobacteria bacterium]|nr:hypothetical protein [Acidobacteriota bacterium]
MSTATETAAMLAHHAAEPFRQRFCRAAACGARFFLCRACDRGQGYCSAVCRTQARAQQLRAARQRHQHSDAGRRDHGDRQRTYRRRLAQRQPAPPLPTPPTPPTPPQENVTDHASAVTATAGKLRASVWAWPAQAQSARTALGALVCRWCGRVGRWLNPFVNTS